MTSGSDLPHSPEPVSATPGGAQPPVGASYPSLAASARLAPRGLLAFVVLRLAMLVVLVMASASSIWLITAVAPGDATTAATSPESNASARRYREALGLDRPLGERYVDWARRAVRADLGVSFQYRQPVTGLVLARVANSAWLAVAALVIATAIGLPLGTLAGSGRWRWLSSLVGGTSLVALSLPPLLTSLILMVLAVRTGWLPVGGMSSVHAESSALLPRAADLARHLVLPALALALPFAATLERVQAAAVAEGRHDRHVLAARALGLPFSHVLWRALWRPTLAPVAGIFGLAAGSVLSGSLAVEIVTAWPGLGRLMFDALGARDVPLAAGCAAAAAAFLAVWTGVADVVVWWLDPRTRSGASS